MYICLCNAIREKELESLGRRGVRSADDAYAALDVEMSCSTCRDYVQEVLDRTLASADAA